MRETLRALLVSRSADLRTHRAELPVVVPAQRHDGDTGADSTPCRATYGRSVRVRRA